MTEKFVIQGEKRLNGEIEVRGAKNAALPILAATILTKEDCIISNLPLIKDVLTMIEILEGMGAKIDWLNERSIKVNTCDVEPAKIRQDLVGKFRGSILFLGPLMARFGYVKLPLPGGCTIGARPIDVHLDAFRKLGAKAFQDSEFCIVDFKEAKSGECSNKEIILKEFSVTATENILMAASLLSTKTKIKIAASDYQVQDLCKFLQKTGVKISHPDFNVLLVEGREKLSGVSHRLVYDPIEAGTFIICGALNKGSVRVRNVPLEHLALFFEKLKEFGVELKIDRNKDNPYLAEVLVFRSRNLLASRVQVLPPPGLYADFQPLFGLLATQAQGTSLIHDPMYEARFSYLNGLEKMGANVTIADPHRALITGPVSLCGTSISSFDLRAGVTLIIAGMIARGQTIINEAYQVDRGYERIEERLQKVGADIKRVKN